MMNFLVLYARGHSAVAPILQRRPKVVVCSLSLAFIALFTLISTLAGAVEYDQSTSRAGFLHCAQTRSDMERLACYDQFVRLANSDIREILGPAAGDLAQCAILVQESVRAACFDAAATVVGDSLVADSSSLVQPTTAISETDLGQEQLETVAQKKSKPKAKEMSATVIDLRRNAFGLYSFHLDNGQIWQQTESERFVPPDNDFRVEIRRGAISGYRLQIDNQNKILRVKRLE